MTSEQLLERAAQLLGPALLPEIHGQYFCISVPTEAAREWLRDYAELNEAEPEATP